MKYVIFIALVFYTFLTFGQVKIGDNISTIDEASILELDSQTKAFVPTRITDAQMNAMAPLKGALVYNTDHDCIFAFDGVIWKNLCNSGVLVTTASSSPINNFAGDIWIEELSHKVHIWNGLEWILTNTNPTSGDGPPSSVSMNTPIAGDIYVDRISGNIFAYNGSLWKENGIYSVENGLTLSSSNSIELGGTLTRPTVITTNTGNTLAIEGLSEAAHNNVKILTVDETTGVLHSTASNTFLQREELTIIAVDGQQEFTTPLAITDSKKIAVYRNGIKIDFDALGVNLIKLEANVICYENDEIRIVQFF
ncbi:hypothetical protein Q4603_09560 [Zobellia galactanivorans]|uniref:Uncharacterized protein n=1 Tax=Zobellia galactanivorans (strain DSM 12802 / CCUG 47099 / CIP 106680 / NCIMB 13871 / Dsij) TaxID=63186 RepID=G0L6L1_ZOBGA|nr:MULTISPECIES: hypothetical protein [Zobellia]MDO6808858.1 hypothetical protein [Zobellia galactanivorans]OWW25823.1 hypothetical protein B4Q04_09525 [Zobellia sp. OII3]CAZ98483.1 Conserved hypothetical protein [Zobellia galactanivorans]